MRHILAPILLMVFLFPSLALGEEVIGNFMCKIKDINILSMEEGIPKTYKGYKEGFKINGNMNFEYKYESLRDYFFIEHSNGKKGEYYFASDYMEPRTENQKELLPEMYLSIESSIFLGSDNLTFDGSVRYLNLERYYKNDWHGQLTKVTNNGTDVYSLDCRHPIDSLDEIMEILKQKGY